ncbi:hypothetical protein BF2512_28 [Dickeya phage BF25/12]|uniref:Uncharacterized protein n=1 Tax=Dickeya phage BF25/12 TaxID=1698708 RepID=A0A219MH37_9CAUD|nr:hypothetical protein HOR10_gp28 [Dickeya phage BF25/12]ALA46485.1 hypothetical protein BF2512_28 [Dickeya phage BF25/12]
MGELEKLISGAIEQQSVDMTTSTDWDDIHSEIIEREFNREVRRNIRSLERDYFPYK